MQEYCFKEYQLNSKSGKPFLYDIAYKVTNSKKPLIIFLHGFKGFKDWGHFKSISDYMISKEVVFLKMNFSHNGTTPSSPLQFDDLDAFGNNNFSKELDDINSILEHILSDDFIIPNTEFDSNNIILLGHSKGGATAIIKSNEDSRISKTVTWASVLEINNRYGFIDKEWKENSVKFYYNGRTDQNMPVYIQLAHDISKNNSRFDIPVILTSYKKPLLLIHPINDTTIPPSELEIARKVNNPNIKIALNKGNHTLDGHHPFCDCKLPESTIRACNKTLNFIFDVTN